jgi:hypothetical protein
LRSLAERFELPLEPDPALSNTELPEADNLAQNDQPFLVVQGGTVVSTEGMRVIEDGALNAPQGEASITIGGFAPDQTTMFSIGAPGVIKFFLDRRAFIRDGYKRGVNEVGITIGDILNYLDARDHVTDCVIEKVEAVLKSAPGKVAFVGESLGGIMLADAMARMKDRKNTLLDKASVLITFASQSAALVAVSSGGAAAGRIPFTPWANIWNRDDLLSYPISYAYQGLGVEVRDHEARHRSLFPEVHSSYISDPKSRLFEFINYELDLTCS